jgi:hypothetical protein
MEKKLKNLRTFNFVMAALHFIQAMAVIFISDPNKGIVPITVSFLRFDTITQKLLPASEKIADVNLAWFIVIFFLICSFAHLFISTIYRKTYEKNLLLGINKVRWFEYALSASVMMIAIGFLSGIYDLASLVMIFTLDAVMNLLGLAMEEHNSKNTNTKTNWLTFIIGSFAGVVPWLVFVIYILAARQYGGGNIPTFVYWIYGSIFLFFNSFAVNMVLQYKKVGPWKDYLFGERVYIILSLVAKSLLAWQVFAGTLRP